MYWLKLPYGEMIGPLTYEKAMDAIKDHPDTIAVVSSVPSKTEALAAKLEAKTKGAPKKEAPKEPPPEEPDGVVDDGQEGLPF